VSAYVTAQTNKYLDAVNELGQRNITPVTKDVDGTEITVGPVLELEAQKVTIVRKRTAAKLDHECRGIVGLRARN
jgi:hypothetical protein